MEDAARVQHIQSMLQPGKLYSVPAAAVQLGRVGQERAPQPAGDGGEALELDVGSSHVESGQNHSAVDADIDVDLALGPANENIFFRVISPPLPAAAGERLGQPDISFTVHHAVKHGDAVSVCVEPIRHGAQTASISVTSLLASNAHMLENGLVAWSRMRVPHLSLRGEDVVDCQHLLAALCNSCALPASDKTLDIPEHHHADLAILTALEQRGFVEQRSRAIGVTSWKFTIAGIQRLSFARRLVKPQLVCAVRQDVPFAGCYLLGVTPEVAERWLDDEESSCTYSA